MEQVKLNKIRESAERVLTSGFCEEVFVMGFKFTIGWRYDHELFEGVMSFSPDYPGTHYFYGDNIDTFVNRAGELIDEFMLIYKEGGHYASHRN